MSHKNAVITCIVIYIYIYTFARVYVVKRRKTETMTHGLLLDDDENEVPTRLCERGVRDVWKEKNYDSLSCIMHNPNDWVLFAWPSYSPTTAAAATSRIGYCSDVLSS